MTLIDRYLHAVRGFLPASRQEDIIRELSEDIHSQVGDREEALGRPLTESETGDLLKRFGHPMVLAAKYRPQHQLIGASLFPFYWFALKMALGAALIVHLAIAIAMVAGGQPLDRIIGPLAVFPVDAAVTVFGWVTLVFAGIQLLVPHLRGFDSWNPNALPTPQYELVPSRVGLKFEIIGSTGFLLWWLAVPRFPFLIFGPASSFLELTPAFHSAHLPIAALWLVSLAGLWTILLRRWARSSFTARLISNGFTLVMALVLLRAGTLVALAHAGEAWAGAADVARAINIGIQLALVVTVAGSVWELLRSAWRSQRHGAMRLL
jgi:hypothetical protein